MWQSHKTFSIGLSDAQILPASVFGTRQKIDEESIVTVGDEDPPGVDIFYPPDNGDYPAGVPTFPSMSTGMRSISLNLYH